MNSTTYTVKIQGRTIRVCTADNLPGIGPRTALQVAVQTAEYHASTISGVTVHLGNGELFLDYGSK